MHRGRENRMDKSLLSRSALVNLLSPRLGSGVRRRWDKQASFGKKRQPTGLCLDSLVAQLVKNPPAMQETRAQSLGHEEPLEKGAATHSSIFTWRTPWREDPCGLQSMESPRVGRD